MTERELMAMDRNYAAMGEFSAKDLRDMATKALLRAYGIANYDPEKAWELMQYAADMQRASLPTKGVA